MLHVMDFTMQIVMASGLDDLAAACLHWSIYSLRDWDSSLQTPSVPTFHSSKATYHLERADHKTILINVPYHVEGATLHRGSQMIAHVSVQLQPR